MDIDRIACLKEQGSFVIYVIRIFFPQFYQQALQFLHFTWNKYMLHVIQEESEAKQLNIERFRQTLKTLEYLNSEYLSVIFPPKDFVLMFYNEAKIPQPSDTDISLDQHIIDYILHNLATDEDLDEISLKYVSPSHLGSVATKCKETKNLKSRACQEHIKNIKSEFCGDKQSLHFAFDEKGDVIVTLQPQLALESKEEMDGKHQVKRTRIQPNRLAKKKPKTQPS